jgi:hypothetical protein
MRTMAASGFGGATKPTHETPFEEKSGTGPLDLAVSAARAASAQRSPAVTHAQANLDIVISLFRVTRACA